MKHFISLKHLNKKEIKEILNLAILLKKQKQKAVFKAKLKNKTTAMIFEKNSTRTRLSCEVGMFELGGHALHLNSNDTQFSRGESLKDSARVISAMVDFIFIRTYKQKDIKTIAKYSSVPVINALSDLCHPTQLIADLLTMYESFGNLDDISDFKIAYVGDGNNMAHSYLMLCSIMGFNLSIATPKGYEVNKNVLSLAKKFAKKSKCKIDVSNDIKKAVTNALVVTTDTWVSMGEDDKKKQKQKAFKGFMVNAKIMSLANKNAIFLHCMPVYKGYEVSSEVFDKFENIIITQASNRLHAQKAIFCFLDKYR